jgi:hypothetical protein
LHIHNSITSIIAYRQLLALIMAPVQAPFLLYYIHFIVCLFAPVAQQRNQKGNATGKKDNAAAEAQHVIVGEALRDEENGADQEQKPAHKVIMFLLFTD